ncbi:MAG: MerR family transcriptional regulator [Christensenellales bacterium]
MQERFHENIHQRASIAYGLTPEALRYYEEKGLLSPDRTASSGFRRFSIADVQRLGIIKSLQRQGFSLDEIKRIITHCPLAELVAMMDEKRRAARADCSAKRRLRAHDLRHGSRCATATGCPCSPASARAARVTSSISDSVFRAVGFRAQTADSESPDRRALPLTSYCTIIIRQLC